MASKYAPRQQHGEASDYTASSPNPRQISTPRSVGATTPRRFSGSTPRSPGGTTLYVAGMGSAQKPRPEAGSAFFRSGTSIGDAHIKDLDKKITAGPYSAPRNTMGGNGTAAFRSKSPSDRDAHMKDLMSRSYGSPRSPSGSSPMRQQLPSASFRSASPIACAHINAMTKPTDASYTAGGRSPDRLGSAAFRSTTSIADAHIKAVPRRNEGGSSVLSPDSSRSCTSPFRSTTTIADAHIKAVPKPVDVVLAYRD